MATIATSRSTRPRYAHTMIAERRDADVEGCGLPRYVERERMADD